MTTTTFGLIAWQRFDDPEVGILLARLNPQTMIPTAGEDLRLPLAADLRDFDRRLGGAALPPGDPETGNVIREKWTDRQPDGYDIIDD